MATSEPKKEQKASAWKPGRGKLGCFEPLLGGTWVAQGSAPMMGSFRCTRTFERVLGGAYIHLRAVWEMGPRSYEEIALFGADVEDGELSFWSFTSDKKQSRGRRAEAELPAGGFAFEADMPAGRARMLYWPAAEGDGFHFAVESKTKKGWNRFLEHRYARA